MSDPAPPRRFVGPFIGIALVFAALGPPIGGATFVPLALLLKAPAAAGAFAFSAVIASLFGHWILLIAAYAVGLGPAVATGVLYALWDAAAPRALAARARRRRHRRLRGLCGRAAPRRARRLARHDVRDRLRRSDRAVDQPDGACPRRSPSRRERARPRLRRQRRGRRPRLRHGRQSARPDHAADPVRARAPREPPDGRRAAPPRLRRKASRGRRGPAPAGSGRLHRAGGGAQEPQGVHRIRPRRAARRSTTCCSSGRPASARRRSPRSWRASSASISARPPAR